MTIQTILITGGAGFIGSHLCEHLVNRGETIVCVDNLGSGKRENIRHMEEKKNFVFIYFDVTDSLEKLEKELIPKNLPMLFQLDKFDNLLVMHVRQDDNFGQFVQSFFGLFLLLFLRVNQEHQNK